ncbi:hypothetical protein [Arthrobacter sp. OAP107]|uniref:hypothetical protein n=1 Tax=Arthrobacter sp. OAP107 TaxID=3156445 RepID=UPI0033964439
MSSSKPQTSEKLLFGIGKHNRILCYANTLVVSGSRSRNAVCSWGKRLGLDTGIGAASVF